MHLKTWVLLATLAVSGCASGGAAPAVDATAPELSLSLQDMQGVEHHLDASLERGETVALVFWQTWCKSCRLEAPELLAAVRDHGDSIRFVGVVPGRDETVDDGEVRRTAAEWGYDQFPQVRDRDLALTQGLEVRGTPTILVLGKGRKVLFRGHRAPTRWERFEGASTATAGPLGSECKDGVCPLEATQ